jgi:hypothetical protein
VRSRVLFGVDSHSANEQRARSMESEAIHTPCLVLSAIHEDRPRKRLHLHVRMFISAWVAKFNNYFRPPAFGVAGGRISREGAKVKSGSFPQMTRMHLALALAGTKVKSNAHTTSRRKGMATKRHEKSQRLRVASRRRLDLILVPFCAILWRLKCSFLAVGVLQSATNRTKTSRPR